MKLLSTKMSKTKSIILAFILSLAAFLRLYQLNSLPISLFGDEIDVGYQAWSLISTGRDYMGHPFPVYMQSLTEWRAPLLMYVVAPFVGIMGPSALSVRLPIALLGIANIVLLFFLVRNLFKNDWLALAAAFCLTISPWHIHYSRAAFEVTLLLTLLLLGCYLYIKNKIYWSLIPFALTFYTYSTANVFTPLLVLSLYLVYRPKIILRKDWLKILPAFLVCLPIAYFILAGQASGRFAGISIFSDQKAVDTLITTRTEPWVVTSHTEAFFHNKPLLYLATFAKNYLTAFSPDFLFLNGDPNFRHSIGEGFGELPLLFAPFLLLGVIKLFHDRDQKSSQLMLFWLFLSPVASSLTQGGGNHATRLFIMLPAVVTISAIGLFFFQDFFSKKTNKHLAAAFIFLASLIFIFAYWHQYANHYRYLSFKNWHYGFSQTYALLPSIDKAKGDIFINNTYEPSLLKYLFFSQYPPSRFQKEFQGDQTQTALLPGFDGFRLGEHLYFGAIQSGIPLGGFLKPGDVYVATQLKEIPGDQDWSKSGQYGFHILGVTYDVYQQPLFTVVEKQ